MAVQCDNGLKLIVKFVGRVFPQVDRQMDRWVEACSECQDETLKTQALESITAKKFHAQGGSVYALYPGVDLSGATNFIVSLQTISDYLDNLCDRAGVYSENSFRQLHMALSDAVDPATEYSDYYLYYPFKQDNSYLRKLVEECRFQLRKLPSYSRVLPAMKKYVSLYSELQSLKHLEKGIREQRLVTWAKSYHEAYPEVSCWEFAAATGSTLGMFMLYAAACNPELTAEEIEAIESAYFPWINGLHILLDYYIDSQEDMEMGDLNFTYYYRNQKTCEERISLFIERAFQSCSLLRHSEFHTTIVKGLLAMYLSDPKAHSGLNTITSRNLLKKGASGTKTYYTVCRALRAVGKL